MELQLVYIYIYKFKGAKRQGFNLHSNYRISFNPTGAGQEKLLPQLSIKVLNSKLPHLFNPQIKDIRGIIGENGAGKSTLIEYLTHAAHDQTYLHDIDGGCRDILIYQTCNSEGLQQLHVVLGSSWDNETIKQHAIAPVETRFIQMSQFQYDELEDFRSTAFVYYSNVFDNKHRPVYGELRSISTDFLIRKDQEKLTNATVLVDPLDAHRTMECRRQVEFVLQYREESNLPINIPEQIYVRYNTFARESLIKKLQNADSGEADTSIVVPLGTWLKQTDDQKSYSKLSLQGILKRAYLHYFIDNLILDEDQISHSSFPGFWPFKLKTLEYIVDNWQLKKGELDLDELIRFVEKGEAIVEQDPHNQKLVLGGHEASIGLGETSLKRYLMSFKYFYDFLFDRPETIEESGPAGFILQLNQDSRELYTRYYNSLFITTYLDFSFPELSSGELGFLTLFSRFYSLVNTTNSLTYQNDNKKNLIIFIDEGDLYFHPSWQAKFLNYVNDMLPRIFPFFSMQLIVSSHSPFIASDLTPNHLLFLKRTNFAGHRADILQAAGKVAEGPEHTFAANIHELLSDSFFMEGAHIGELAKNILYQMLDQLERKETARHFSNKELLALIEEVGESWMRSRLMEKFNNYQRFNNR